MSCSWRPLLAYAHARVTFAATRTLPLAHWDGNATPPDLSDALRNAGLTHVPFDHPGDETLAPIWARLRGVSQQETNAIAIREIFAGANARAALPKLSQTIRERRPDLIVRESAEFGALVAAEVHGVPHARVAVHMVSFEEPFPTLAGPALDALREQAGVPADAGRSLRAEPVFTWFPSSLDGSNDDGSQTRIPFRAQLSDGAPSDVTAPWVQGEAPLVYITFGTLAGSSPEGMAVYRTALEAISALPVRALFTTGRGVDVSALGAIPSNVHMEAFVPRAIASKPHGWRPIT